MTPKTQPVLLPETKKYETKIFLHTKIASTAFVVVVTIFVSLLIVNMTMAASIILLSLASVIIIACAGSLLIIFELKNRHEAVNNNHFMWWKK